MENIFVEFLPPWVETGLQPAFYDKESGTVLQQTARMYARVNMLIRMFNKLSKNTRTTVEDYINQFNELHDYVHDYFDNLDVQGEINNKLDEMYDNGQLSEIIVEFLKLKGILGYGTVASMKSATELINGSLAETYGFYSKGDGGGAKYIIRTITNQDVVDEETIFALNDQTLVAELLPEDEMNILQFGIVGDGTTDLSTKLNKALSYRGNDYIKINFNEGETYLAQNNIYLYSNTRLNLNGSTIKSCHDNDDTDYIEFGNGLRFLNNEASVLIDGYGAIENIEVYNGTFDGYQSGIGFFILHGLNIKFHDLTLKDCCVGTHIFDLGGCKDIEIKNCNFNGYLISNPSNNYREMIQFDYANRTGMPYWGYSGNDFDGLPCVNLVVDNCEFSKGSGTYYPCGVGSHSASILHHKYITIQNCKFNKTSSTCIRIPKAKFVNIKNNTIDGDGGVSAISCQCYNSDADDNITENIVIDSNHIYSRGNYKYGVRLSGLSVDGNITYLQNVKIINNTFTHLDNVSQDIDSIALSIGNVQNVEILNNEFNEYKFVGLKVNGTVYRNSIISGNKCTNCLFFIASPGNETSTWLDQCTGITESDNIWSDATNGTFNINNFKLILTCTNELTADSTTQKYYMCPLDIRSNTIGKFLSSNEYNYSLPPCVKHVKVTGIMNITCGSRTWYKVFRLNSNVDGTFTRIVGCQKTFTAQQQDEVALECLIGNNNTLTRSTDSINIGFDAHLEVGDKINNEFGPSKLSYLIIEGC